MSTLSSLLFVAPVAVYLCGALLALCIPRADRLAHGFSFFASLLLVILSVQSLLSPGPEQHAAFAVAPFAVISLRLDPLSAFFTLVIGLIGVAASLYAIGYLDGERSAKGWLAAAFNVFLAAMMLVVVSDSVFGFLFTWELMSLVSFFLVIYHHHDETARRAGYVYLVMTHASSAFLLVAFLALYVATGSFRFADIHAAAPALNPLVRDLVFLCALVAFGTKAGLIPLHVWLPRAHPAAPSHVSAVMSGVMIKMGIYGLLRIGWDVLGPGPVWWGALLLGLGAVSAVLGVLYALMEHDLKRLLAYHSVENVGIILMGIGAGFLLMSLGHPLVAALALLAAVYHVLNHALFKSLLFLGAGAVQQSARTRDLEALGGLIKRMPWTSLFFLIGAAAISALPPLNGFVSEWLTFQALLGLASSGQSALAGVGGAAAAALLALTGGLAAFCFVKAFGIAFLGMPRSAPAAEAREASGAMLWGMGVLAVLCVALGILPSVVVRLAVPVTASLAGTPAQPSLATFPSHETISRDGSYAPLALLLALCAAAGLGFLVARSLGGPGRRRVAPPWCCGITLEPTMQYTAAALAKPVRIIFRALVRPYRHVERLAAPETPYFVSGVSYEAGIQPIYERYFYRPAVGGLLKVAHQIRALQNGSLRVYLAYICVSLVVLLLLTRLEA